MVVLGLAAQEMEGPEAGHFRKARFPALPDILEALLMADGDAALTELLDEYPNADRQHLRQLARNAHEEKLRNKPPHAFRELFRELRELLKAPDTDDGEPEIAEE